MAAHNSAHGPEPACAVSRALRFQPEQTAGLPYALSHSSQNINVILNEAEQGEESKTFHIAEGKTLILPRKDRRRLLSEESESDPIPIKGVGRNDKGLE